jgi:4-amino-4-deoxy-L-arabinose transferase-like glycosyltransferase
MTAMNPGETPGRKIGPWLCALALLGLLARLAVAAPSLRAGRLEDPDNYLVLARGLAQGQGLAWQGRPTAYRPPLYPLLLAPVVAAPGTTGKSLAWAVVALHGALGAGTVALTVAAACRWGLGAGRALAAGAIVAFDPVLVAQGRMVMTENLAAFLLAASLAALAVGPAPGGLALGLAVLCRPSALPAAALIAVAAVVLDHGPWRDRLRRGAFLAASTLAVLAPWAIRNARVLGEPVWTTTHGGYTLALANNPVYYAEVLDGPPGAVWSGANQRRWFDAIGPRVAGLSEPAADRRLRGDALRLIRERPRDFVRASIARLARFWSVVPAAAVYPGALRLATAAWTVPLWLALGVGLTRRSTWRWPRVAAPLWIVALSAVHTVYWTDLRMRAPLVPAIALVAVAAAEVPFASALWLSRNRRSTGRAGLAEVPKKIWKFADFCCSKFRETLG